MIAGFGLRIAVELHPQSAIRNPQSAIRNQQSAISNLRRRVSHFRRHLRELADQLLKLERLVQRLAAAGGDQLECPLARVTGREERAISQMGLDRRRQLEEDVAAQVGDAKIEDEKVEVLGAEEGVRLLASLDGEDVIAGAPEGDRQRTTDRRFIVDHEYTQPLIEAHSFSLLVGPVAP